VPFSFTVRIRRNAKEAAQHTAGGVAAAHQYAHGQLERFLAAFHAVILGSEPEAALSNVPDDSGLVSPPDGPAVIPDASGSVDTASALRCAMRAALGELGIAHMVDTDDAITFGVNFREQFGYPGLMMPHTAQYCPLCH
jgi:hypothetical protein